MSTGSRLVTYICEVTLVPLSVRPTDLDAALWYETTRSSSVKTCECVSDARGNAANCDGRRVAQLALGEPPRVHVVRKCT